MTRFVSALTLILSLPVLASVQEPAPLVLTEESGDPSTATPPPVEDSPTPDDFGVPDDGVEVVGDPAAFPERSPVVLRLALGGGAVMGSGGDSYESCYAGRCNTRYEIEVLEGFGRFDMMLGGRLLDGDIASLSLSYHGSVSSNDLTIFSGHTALFEVELIRSATIGLGGGVTLMHLWNVESDTSLIPLPTADINARFYFGNDSMAYFDFNIAVMVGSDRYFRETMSFASYMGLIGVEIL